MIEFLRKREGSEGSNVNFRVVAEKNCDLGKDPGVDVAPDIPSWLKFSKELGFAEGEIPALAEGETGLRIRGGQCRTAGFQIEIKSVSKKREYGLAVVFGLKRKGEVFAQVISYPNSLIIVQGRFKTVFGKKE